MTTAVSPQNLHSRRGPDREDDDNRFYDGVGFASDSYIPWMVGKLRLGRADLSRMRSSGVPVLRSHQPDNLVGAVVRVSKSDGVWRSDWRLPKIAANTTTFSQMDTGILRGISVGGNLDWATLTIDNEGEADWSDPDSILFSADWMLVEESLTAIPADVRAGVDREALAILQRDAALFDTLITDAGITTLSTPQTLQRLETLVTAHNQNVAIRRQQAMTTKPLEQTIPPDLLQRAVAEEMARNDALKRFTEVPDKLDQLITSQAEEEQRNMEYRAKLDKIQYQPNGQVLQLSNWNPAIHQPLDIGRVLRLTADRELGFPPLDPASSTLEESFLERQELAQPDRNTAARVPFEAIMARTRQRTIQRNTMSGAAGARPTEVNIVGDGGLLFNDYSSILAALDVRMGLRGSQRVPFFTAQGTAAGAAEAAAIPITIYTVNDLTLLPVSIASAFDLSSSLTAADEGVFEAMVDFAIFSVVNDELVGQLLDGGGTTANELAGLWGRVSTSSPDNAHEYGAAATDFDRADVLTTKNAVDLSKTDGGAGQWILGDGLYQLAENTLRGGASSERFLLENMMMEDRTVHHFKDFAPSGTNDAGLFGKLNRVTLLLWGDSFQLEEVPVLARKSQYKMVAECQISVVQPDHNLARIARS